MVQTVVWYKGWRHREKRKKERKRGKRTRINSVLIKEDPEGRYEKKYSLAIGLGRPDALDSGLKDFQPL